MSILISMAERDGAVAALDCLVSLGVIEIDYINQTIKPRREVPIELFDKDMNKRISEWKR